MSRQTVARTFWAVAALGLTTFGAAAFAQQQSSDRTTSGGSASDRTTSDGNASDRTTSDGNATGSRHMRAVRGVDQHITHCLINDNKEEVALGQLAQQRASNEEVKKFAAKMVEDHTKFLNRLQSLPGAGDQAGTTTGSTTSRETSTTLQTPSGERSSTRTTEQTPSGQSSSPRTTEELYQANQQSRTGTDRDDSRGNRRAGRRMGQVGGASAAQFVQILDEVAQQCQQSKIREMSQKSGQQFDMCYMGSQVDAHMKMLDKLTVFNSHASAELQPILQEGIQTTKQHLSHAKEIHQRIEQGQTKTTASR